MGESQVGMGEGSPEAWPRRARVVRALRNEHSRTGDWLKGASDRMRLMCGARVTG